MNILSLFDGMSCGMIAFKKLQLNIDKYFAYEIDRYATHTTSTNFPEIIQCGDVFNADFSQYTDIDFLIGGSPCTYWSIAQKKNRETEASGIGWELFSAYVKALRIVKPTYFIYENNKSMSKQIRQSITETFGFDAVCINSSLVSAQNRQRLYWVGKRNGDNTYTKVEIEQPNDKQIYLKDILDKDLESVNSNKGKSQTLKAQYAKSSLSNFCRYTSTYGATGVAEPVLNKPFQVGSMPRPNGELSTSQAFRVYDINAKSVTINSGGGGAGGKTGLYAIPIEFNLDCPTKAISNSDGKIYTVYEVKTGLISIKDKEYPIKLNNGYYIIRKLTVNECKRLQTVPECYKFPVSDAQAYKMLGNGWTVDVITHLIKCCLRRNFKCQRKGLIHVKS